MNLRKKAIDHSLSVLLFLFVTVIFFAPQYFENKSLSQFDITQWYGSAKETIDYREDRNQRILWTNSQFSGMPTYLVSLTFSFNPGYYLFRTTTLWLPNPANRLFACLIGFYILLLAFRVERLYAVVGALSFGLSSFVIIGLVYGHNSRIGAIGMMPIILAGLHMVFTNRKYWGSLLLLLGLAIQLYLNHLQITYYTMILCFLYGISEVIYRVREQKAATLLPVAVPLLVAVVLAVGLNAGSLLTLLEYSQYSNRAPSELSTAPSYQEGSAGVEKDYAFSHSNSLLEPLVLFIPNFMGGPTKQVLGLDSHLGRASLKNGVPRGEVREKLKNSPTYMGDQPGTAPYYAGAIMVFLCIVGLFFVPGRYKYWLLAALLLGIMMSWGKHFAVFNEFLLYYLPGYSKFRSITYTLILTVFAINLLGILGLSQLAQQPLQKATLKKLAIALGATAGLALLLSILAGLGRYEGALDATRLAAVQDWFLDALKKDRKELFQTDAFRSFGFIVLSAGALWLYLRKKINYTLFGAILIALITLDHVVVDKRYFSSALFVKSREIDIPLTATNKHILKEQGHYRVLNINETFVEGYTSRYHKSIGGYNAAKLRRYQDLTEVILAPMIDSFHEQLARSKAITKKEPVLNMLNTRYIRHGKNSSSVTTNYNAYGNAWFAETVKRVQSPDEEMARLRSAPELFRLAILDEQKFALSQSTYDTTGSIALDVYNPDRMIYKTSGGKGKRLAVFSEVFYPEGWTATIDQTEVPIVRVNYLLRAIEVPAGEHTIVFEFRPASYYVGDRVMLFSFGLMLLALAAVLYQDYKKGRLSAKAS